MNPDLLDFYRQCPQARSVPDAAAGRPAAVATNTADVLLPGAGAAATPTLPGVPRIAVWGDSHTAAGDFVYAAMAQWGFARGGIRPGMVAPALAVPGVNLPLKKTCMGAGWKTVYAPRVDSAAVKAMRWTPTLMQLQSETPGDYVWLDFRMPDDAVRLKWLNIHFARQHRDRSLVLKVSVDNGPEQLVVLSGTQAPFFQVRPRRPLAHIRIRLVAGQIAIQGFEPVYQEPPKAILDIFSIPGSIARVWSDTDSASWGRQYYSTVLFAYGTNDATDPDYSEASYSLSLRQSLGRFRMVSPQARCILIGPPDRGGTSRGTGLSYTLIHKMISDAQARLAGAVGCVAWNWQAAQGGMGAASRLLAANPPLMQKDLVHLTQQGYEESGHLFAKKIPWKHYCIHDTSCRPVP